MAVQYVATQPIIELSERFSRRPGAWVSWRWWELEGLDLGGGKGESIGGVGRRGGSKRGGGNDTGRDDGPRVRAGSNK